MLWGSAGCPDRSAAGRWRHTMAATLHKIRVYGKLAAVVAVFVLAAVFLLQNRERVGLRFLFWQTPAVPKYLFVLGAAAAGVVIFQVGARVGRVVREVRQMRRDERAAQEARAPIGPKIESKGSS